jgi:glycosyltransferase involved in cell wall biosynthesis
MLVFTGMVEGTPAVKGLRKSAANVGAANRIITLERLPFDEMQRYTAACDVGILLYPNDGIGNFYQAPGRLTQYLACGLPVLASDFPSLELLILKHGLGAIARGLSALMEMPAEQRRQRATRLRALARTELCYDLFTAQLEQAVRSAGHPSGTR